MIQVEKSAKVLRAIYDLTRYQTEHLMMDFSGQEPDRKKTLHIK